jgi:exodeoxyribonuclease VIII
MHVMMDLETLDTKPGAVLLSIGAVVFDCKNDLLGAEFHQIINVASSVAAGLTISADTEAWWAKQSAEAQKTLTDAKEGKGKDLKDALNAFGHYMDKLGPPSKTCLWGNGSDFDNVLLIAAYERAKMTPPWKFYNNRCYRTLKSLKPGIKLVREGTYHNALDDAKTQARHAIQLLR